jgi:drug/metabolite transporter superfamily protein YnfA
MIKTLKLQKAVFAFILGLIALIVYIVLAQQKNDSATYFLEAAGLLFMVGALMFLYPILFAKKDRAGCVELDPAVHVEEEADETPNVTQGEVRMP